MATITLNDANNDGTGINLLTYFSSWESSFVNGYFGYFNENNSPFSGNQFAITESSSTTVSGVGSTVASVVVDSGAGDDLYYNYSSHILAGDVDGVTFGNGLSYSSVTDTFTQNTWDIDISGLGVTVDADTHDLVYGLMSSDTSDLLDVLDSQNNTIISSSGDDVVQGYSNVDTFVFDANWGEDTIYYFSDGQDLIDLSAFGFDDLSDFTSSGGSVTGSGTAHVEIAYSGNTIDLYDTSSITLTDADFVWA